MPADLRRAGAAARLQGLAMVLVALGMVGMAPGRLFEALVLVLGALSLLKLWEARSPGERRQVGLLQLIVVGLQSSLRPSLGPSLLQGLTLLVTLAGLLALEAEAGSDARDLLRRSGLVLMAALPITLALFLLLPRLEPFTSLPSEAGSGAVSGLSETLDPGGIAELTTSREAAARVSFAGGEPPPPEERYWRVLVQDRFDGSRWQPATPLQSAVRAGGGGGGDGQGGSGGGARRFWLVEASGLPAVPWSGRGRPLGADLRLTGRGELLHRGPPRQRRLYQVNGEGGGDAWRRTAPTAGDRSLPLGLNPRLERLGASWATLEPASARLAAAERWFRSQPFRYTLQPGALPSRAPLDHFLFESREGFCGHYASAFTALMRAAGLPARVVSGYRGGEWIRPIGGSGYLDLRQADAHAWSEVWLPQEGWRQVDPSAWLAGGDASSGAAGGRRDGGGNVLSWLRHQWWGLDLAWSRLWLDFDASTQAALWRRLLGDRVGWAGLIAVGAAAGGLAAGLAALTLLGRWQERPRDPFRRELERWLALLARCGMEPQAGESLPRFSRRLARRWPPLAADLAAFTTTYEQARFGPCNGVGPEGEPHQARLRQLQLQTLRRLRRRLRRHLEQQLGHREGRRLGLGQRPGRPPA